MSPNEATISDDAGKKCSVWWFGAGIFNPPWFKGIKKVGEAIDGSQNLQFRQELKITKQKAIWRFEGLPGEYLQVDWGEKRNFPFTMIPQETRYCFVGRLKYSRFLYAEFQDNMRYETFIRCLIRCLESLGGIPWVLVFDNMGTVTKGRNEDGNPIWNPKFRQFASEIGFHPEVCAPYSPNQKMKNLRTAS